MKPVTKFILQTFLIVIIACCVLAYAFVGSIFIYAVEHDKPLLTNICLSINPSLTEIAPSRWHDAPAISVAISSRNTNVIKILINADAHLKCNSDIPPLGIATYNGYYDAVKMLVDNGVDVNQTNNMTLTAPMHNVMAGYRLTETDRMVEVSERNKCLEYLVANGADVNIQDSKGRTPLHWACMTGYYWAVEYLLSQNADKNIKDANGHTAIDTAKEYINKPRNSDRKEDINRIITLLKGK